MTKVARRPTKLLTVVGARPQFIKAAVVSRAIELINRTKRRERRFEEILVHTNQHYDEKMSALFFKELNIPEPSHHLRVGSGLHGQQTARMLERLEPVMLCERPDLVLVYGDTNSTLAASLVASKLGIPVAHVEAGLRSYNRAMPEEINRVVTDHLSTLLFCPTDRAMKNLSCEGIVTGVHHVGDVMYDSLLYHLALAERRAGVLAEFGLHPGEYGLATIHRADTADCPQTIIGVLSALARLGLPVIVPLHPRTRVALDAVGVGQAPGLVRLIPPVSYHEMLMLERHARIILTDSGGVQKEAFLLRVPCVTLRSETEWVETVDAGWNLLAGTDPDAIEAAARQLLRGPSSEPGRPYGDGHAADAILKIIENSRLGEIA